MVRILFKMMMSIPSWAYSKYLYKCSMLPNYDKVILYYSYKKNPNQSCTMCYSGT